MDQKEFISKYLEIAETRPRWRKPAKELCSEFFENMKNSGFAKYYDAGHDVYEYQEKINV